MGDECLVREDEVSEIWNMCSGAATIGRLVGLDVDSSKAGGGLFVCGCGADGEGGVDGVVVVVVRRIETLVRSS